MCLTSIVTFPLPRINTERSFLRAYITENSETRMYTVSIVAIKLCDVIVKKIFATGYITKRSCFTNYKIWLYLHFR